MNKKSKKRIIGLALVLALFAIIASGTLAYFTDETEVATNAFTVGKVQIRLSETLVDEKGLAKDTVAKPSATADYVPYDGTDANGNVWDVTGETLVETRTDKGNNKDNDKATKVKGYDGNDYGYALMPGKTVDKDPVVTVLKNSEDSFVRVKVTLDHASEFLTVFNRHIEAGDITFNGTTTADAENMAKAIAAVKEFFVGYDETVWEAVDAEVKDNKVTVTFNYIGTTLGEKIEDGGDKDIIVPKNEDGNTNLEAVITAVTLPAWVTSDDAELFETKANGEVTAVGFNVDFLAQAIQAAGFDDAEAAWKAFDGKTEETQSGDNTTAPTNGN